MKSVLQLQREIKARFPEIAKFADSIDLERRTVFVKENSYLWFGSLAEAINADIRGGVPYETHRDLFAFLSVSLTSGSEEVNNCIDVSFVENLFWEVPSKKGQAYWTKLPNELQTLYMNFHGREP